MSTIFFDNEATACRALAADYAGREESTLLLQIAAVHDELEHEACVVETEADGIRVSGVPFVS